MSLVTTTKLGSLAVDEITALHLRIAGYCQAGLQDAIRIGKLLMQQKDALPHGEFTSWVRENLPFSDRTAWNYMRLYERRAELKTETVSVLSEAYRLLRARKELETLGTPSRNELRLGELADELGRLAQEFSEEPTLSRRSTMRRAKADCQRLLVRCVDEYQARHGVSFEVDLEKNYEKLGLDREGMLVEIGKARRVVERDDFFEEMV